MSASADSNDGARIEAALDSLLPPAETSPERLHAAMRYAVLGGGKRIRPRLLLATGAALGLAADQLIAPACAVECIHAYSLIHDDLPAMDDDALRRGRATVHIAFDEATAILAGDALQSLAFETIASDDHEDVTDAIRGARLATLARACGSRGMVGGQALDMASEGQAIDIDTLERLHRLKTGALLQACVALAADGRPDLTAVERAALERFAERIGLAFQVRDDVLDIDSDTATLGKTQGADIAHSKATYPALLGLEPARAYAERLYAEAIEALAIFGERAAALRAIAAEIVQRDH
jgi:geranylgeranyl pyrophosphate synthase